MVENIATFTNAYATKHITNFLHYGDKSGASIDTTPEEIYNFVALIIYMGLVDVSTMSLLENS